MALETGNYINDLVATNPTSTDPKSQGDDHLRLIKNALKNSLAGFTGVVIATGTESQGATDNDYVVTISPAPAAYTVGMTVLFESTHLNSGATTLAVNALGAKSLLDIDGNTLVSGDIKNGAVVGAFYDGTNFVVISGNDRSNRSGDTYAGSHNFTSAVTTVATQTANDNSSKAANTAYVDAGVAAEANIRSAADMTLQNNINDKAGLDSPTFTGIPTAPTASTGTSTSQLATTAFVAAAAFNAALPAQSGNAGKFVTTDGTNASWVEIKDPTAKMYFIGQI